MEYTINYWVKHIRTEVFTDGLNMGAEVTDEQAARMLASYQSGKFEYMNDDETLQDILAPWEKEERAKGYTDSMTDLPLINDEMALIFEYPDEIRKMAFDQRKPLTREEISYYEGDRRVECPEDDYKQVAIPDEIAKKAEFDVVTRRKKRPREDFVNDAEYRLYLVTLYDIAQLDEIDMV